jgi:hypothetical protein
LFRSVFQRQGRRHCQSVPDFVIGTVTKNEPLLAVIRACKIPVTDPG